MLTSVIDAFNRETDYTYDANGNVMSIKRLAGTSNAVTTSFSYDPKFNELASVTDPLNHTTTFQYDTSGNLMSISDPLNHQSTFTYNPAGQVLTAIDATQNTTQFSYDSGDLVGITDPLGNSTSRYVDTAGRIAAVSNALGRRVKYTYNPLNEILQITDPLQGVTSFSYDANGNLLTVQDANQNTTTYTYNNRDLVATKTDPLQRMESYAYDASENAVTFTDRKGQVTTYAYDNLNRLNFVGFGTQGSSYSSTISYQYDSANHMTQATDSISGAVSRGYDGLDRVTSETTPQGSITYTYDNASRRATMQVAGQSQVGYTFDNANRLTQIAQGTSTVVFTYDNANRRSMLTLPNGIVATYSYDNNSHLAGIAYTLNSNPVGALNYGYDALGMRNSVSGSFARTGLPQPIPSASYDAGNELLTWNESVVSYDANGNMLSDGVHNYAWDARNHLSTVDSGSTGNFVYDSAGRRQTKVISGTSTNFLYDLANPVQELSGTTPTANLLTGGVDEYFSRTDSGGARNSLTDVLGSTVALADTAGAVQAQYTFDPFGNTAQSGNSGTNSFAYTGREIDGTGLYFYRARYYSPSIGRFISEDPIGFDSGDVNLYAYVANDPINLIDPSGLTWQSNWNYFWDWALGGGKRIRNYGPNDLETQELMNSPGINNLRDAFNRGGCKSQNHLSYDTFRAYWDTVANPVTADWSNTAAEVGGFGGASITNNGNGTATFTIPNTSGTHSFFLHLVPDRKSPTGDMSNIYQTFQWTEPLSGRNCGCQR